MFGWNGDKWIRIVSSLGIGEALGAARVGMLADLLREESEFLMKIVLLMIVVLVSAGSALGQDQILKSYVESGLVSLDRGKYAEAETLFRAALSEIGRTSTNEDFKTSATIVSLNGLSMALMNQKKYVEAKAATRKQITVMEAARKVDNPDYAVALNNLGLILTHQRKFSEAIEVHRRALSLREKNLGGSDPDVAVSLLNLGKVYFDQNRHPEAEAVLSRAVAILTQVPTESQTDENMLALAICDMNLSSIKVGQKKYEEAEEYLLVTLMIRTKIQGANHPDLIEPLQNYVTLLRLTNRLSDALAIEARLRRIKAAGQ